MLSNTVSWTTDTINKIANSIHVLFQCAYSILILDRQNIDSVGVILRVTPLNYFVLQKRTLKRSALIVYGNSAYSFRKCRSANYRKSVIFQLNAL